MHAPVWSRVTARAIIGHGADTLFGMPSYVWQLLHAEADALRAYGDLRKVFYGGEHFAQEQQRTLKATFGIEAARRPWSGDQGRRRSGTVGDGRGPSVAGVRFRVRSRGPGAGGGSTTR
ncbi:hypothetical protein MTF65_03360 [Streptomyces sp. APSN-46.1]|uniref:hypothetical protein n=1 Tax=Streptomyces sp. APSN-46.1 TaxID=2929049 RepID=UPI001FB55F24|nr:hypothetical protein [Streptomyces sp. APSN-46.1]MCJ1676404.1 hypothetical protein [Streptomyces sp. APSN-46.1]